MRSLRGLGVDVLLFADVFSFLLNVQVQRMSIVPWRFMETETDMFVLWSHAL